MELKKKKKKKERWKRLHNTTGYFVTTTEYNNFKILLKYIIFTTQGYKNLK